MLSAFPVLTVEEFDAACRALVEMAPKEGGWSMRLVTTTNGTSLNITQCIPEVPGEQLADPSQETLEHDPEALIRDPSPSLHIDYNIQLSPTYRVPVLYFALRSTHAPLGLDAVYQYVVPEQYKKELKSVGVMGGISFGYHPDSGAPAFFVHPCNTANAMAHTADAQSVTPAIYLLIWLGLVGHCVNLHVPREFFAQDGTSPA